MKVKIAIARHVVVAVAASVLGAVPFVLAGCGDSDSPAAPSALTAAPDASAGGGAPAGPAVGNRAATPASFHADGLKPAALSGFNAYDFEASWDGEHLRLALIEDEMRSMREASKPHRNRLITVMRCPSEPHHVLQSCGDPIWRGSRALSGRLELPPVPLASCAGWIVVNAAELSDDRQDGWRNAPCPASDGESVIGSDGTGEGWPEYPEPPLEPAARAARVQRIADAGGASSGSLVAGSGPVSVAEVSTLFEGAGDTAGDEYRATSSNPAVATVEITPNPRVVVTPVSPGTVTIEIVFLRSGARVDFDATVFHPLPLHELPFTRSDRTGDGGELDLTSFSIARPDASGWAAVTFTTAGTVDPTALDNFALAVDVQTEGRLLYEEQWHMRISGSAWSFGYDADLAPNDGNPYVRTSQSTAAASSFSFEIRLIPEIRNQVGWLGVHAVYGSRDFDDDFPGDAVETFGAELINGQRVTPVHVFGDSNVPLDERFRNTNRGTYRVRIP